MTPAAPKKIMLSYMAPHLALMVSDATSSTSFDGVPLRRALIEFDKDYCYFLIFLKSNNH